MPPTFAPRSVPTLCDTCGRNLAADETHITGWVARRIVYYCAGHPCDPRNGDDRR